MKKAWRTISSSVRTPYFGTFRGKLDALTRRTRKMLQRVAFGSVLVTIVASAAAAALLIGSFAPPTDIPRQALPAAVEGTAPLAPVEVADEPGAGRIAAPEAATGFLGSQSEPTRSETTSISTTTSTVLEALPLDAQVAAGTTVPALDVDASVPGGSAAGDVVEVAGTTTTGSGDGIQPQLGDVEVPVSDPAPPPVTIYPPDIPKDDGSRPDEEPPVISDPVEVPDLEIPDDTVDDVIDDAEEAADGSTDDATDTVDQVIEGADEVGDAIDTPSPDDTVDEVTDAAGSVSLDATAGVT